MIEPYEFQRILAPLTALYGDMATERMDIYYAQLGRRDAFILRRAVDRLIKTYDMRSMPLPSHILGAYIDLAKDMPRQVAHEFDCEYCNNLGCVTVPHKDAPWHDLGYMVAVACACAYGKDWEKRMRAHDRKIRRRRQ